MNQKIYIAYGSNMDIRQMKRRCPDARLIGSGILKDYRLTFRSHGVANIEPEAGMQVPVLIWLITDACECALDIYEGFPRLYVKKNIVALAQFQDGKRTISGMAYVMAPAAAREYGRPRKSYFNCIREAYEHNDFDQDILCSAYEIANGGVMRC